MTKKNKVFAEKCKQNEYAGSTVGEKETEIQAGLASAKAPEEALIESSSTDVQVGAVARPSILLLMKFKCYCYHLNFSNFFLPLIYL